MSQWTHITATLSVNAGFWGKERKKLTREVNRVLSKAPKIKGSERDADVRFFIQGGHNSSERIRKGVCKRYQTCITISVQGDLRDRDKDEVKEDLKNFVGYIDEKFWMHDGSYGISDDWLGNETGSIIDLIPKNEEEVEK